jgi:hypothetical protein
MNARDRTCVFSRALLLMLAAGGMANAAADTSLPGMTYASIARLPDFSGFWNLPEPIVVEIVSNPPPLRPEHLQRLERARAQDSAPDKARYCRPFQFVGYSGGFVDSVEFLFTPGRVTITNESGMIRRVYTDGRPLPTEPEPTNNGASVGHWDGTTLVVETVGLNPESAFPQGGAPGAIAIGRNAKITERISLQDANTLTVDIVTVAPDILTRTDHRVRVYKRATAKKAAREVSFCSDHDRSIDPDTGKQRFDMTPPADLPPPPPK